MATDNTLVARLEEQDIESDCQKADQLMADTQ